MDMHDLKIFNQHIDIIEIVGHQESEFAKMKKFQESMQEEVLWRTQI